MQWPPNFERTSYKTRIVSLTFGRPFMISSRSADTVPMPAAIDDEYLSDDPKINSTQPKDRPPIMAFFAQSLELYKILSSILLTLYSPADDESPTTDIYGFYFGDMNCEGLSNAFELDRNLTNWARNLPPYLKANTPESNSNDILYRQTNILRARCVSPTPLNPPFHEISQIPSHPYAPLPTHHVPLLHNSRPPAQLRPANISRTPPENRSPMLHPLRQSRPRNSRADNEPHHGRWLIWTIASMVVQHPLYVPIFSYPNDF